MADLIKLLILLGFLGLALTFFGLYIWVCWFELAPLFVGLGLPKLGLLFKLASILVPSGVVVQMVNS